MDGAHKDPGQVYFAIKTCIVLQVPTLNESPWSSYAGAIISQPRQ